MEQAILALNHKLDALTAQVQYLTEQVKQAELARQARDELVRDAMPIANDLMRLSSDHLQTIQGDLDLPTLARLLKKLLRHAPDFERVLDQLDGVNDLLEVSGPIVKGVYDKAETMLSQAERKGYFRAAQGGLYILDNIVGAFSPDEIRQLGDNIVLILRTIKDMTQPEVMQFLRNTVAEVEKDSDAPVDISYRALLGQMRDPHVRRGLAQTLRVLSSIGGQGEVKH
ncbi:MAG: hypothetical protein KIH69_019965 [Anaerolineae bacterium]|nr:hypothetical protein [Anaerolineae bacterium]